MSSKRISAKDVQMSNLRRYWIAIYFLLALSVCVLVIFSVHAFAKSVDSSTQKDKTIFLESKLNQFSWVSDIDDIYGIHNIENRVANSQNSVFYVSKGILSSRDLKTGRINWRSGKSLLPTILYSGNTLVVGNQSNIFGFAANNGKILWQTKSKGLIESFKSVKNGFLTFFTKSKYEVGRYEILTGKNLWLSSEYDSASSDYSSYFFELIDDFLIIYGSFHGLLQADYTICVSVLTGKILWKKDGIPIRVKNNEIIIAENKESRHNGGDLDFIIKSLDYRNGKIINDQTSITIQGFDLSTISIPLNADVGPSSPFDIWSNNEKLWTYTTTGYTFTLENRNLDNLHTINSREDVVTPDYWLIAKNSKYSLGIKAVSGNVYDSNLNNPIFSVSKGNDGFSVSISEDRLFVVYEDGVVRCYSLPDGIILGTTNLQVNLLKYYLTFQKIDSNIYIVITFDKIMILKLY